MNTTSHNVTTELQAYRQELEQQAQRWPVEDLHYLLFEDGQESDEMCAAHIAQHQMVHGGKIVSPVKEEGSSFSICAMCSAELSVMLDEQGVESELDNIEKAERRYDAQEAYRIVQIIRGALVLAFRDDLHARILKLRRTLN